jgi:hypothetical protein
MDEREWARKEVKNDLKLRKYHMSFWTQLYIIHTLANPGFRFIFKQSFLRSSPVWKNVKNASMTLGCRLLESDIKKQHYQNHK